MGFDILKLDSSKLRLGLESLDKRGPDGSDEVVGDKYYLGHKRLAIIDLSVNAIQPFRSSCNDWLLVFNGEIYNYLDLKQRLIDVGYKFYSNSDTEVVMNSFLEYGTDMLPMLKGMFSILFFNVRTTEVVMARDPYGIKPLYLGFYDTGFIVSSQVKSIIATGLIDTSLSTEGRLSFEILGSICGENSIFENVSSILPGSYIRIKNGTILEKTLWKDISHQWNHLISGAELGRTDLTSVIGKSVKESVSRHLVSDVPVAVFLSV
jgi:asparagine synthase (glutamine-hydrolysing)